MTVTADPATAQQAANNRGITIGTEVHGDLGRPGTAFTGHVIEIYAVHLGGFEVPAVKVQTADGSMRYTLLGDVELARGSDDTEEPRTPEEFAAMLGDIEAATEALAHEQPTIAAIEVDRDAALAALAALAEDAWRNTDPFDLDPQTGRGVTW